MSYHSSHANQMNPITSTKLNLVSAEEQTMNNETNNQNIDHNDISQRPKEKEEGLYISTDSNEKNQYQKLRIKPVTRTYQKNPSNISTPFNIKTKFADINAYVEEKLDRAVIKSLSMFGKNRIGQEINAIRESVREISAKGMNSSGAVTPRMNRNNSTTLHGRSRSSSVAFTRTSTLNKSEETSVFSGKFITFSI